VRSARNESSSLDQPLGTDVFDIEVRAELERVKRPDTELEVRSLHCGPHHLEYHVMKPGSPGCADQRRPGGA